MEKQQARETSTKKEGTLLRNIIIAAVLLAIAGVISFLVFRGKPATDIAFYNDKIELIAGDTQKLDYAILPGDATNKSVKWKSSNPSIATVNEIGEITAISEGETVIIITTSNGKLGECLVTVRPTAFDYLKKLGNLEDGYTVGSYSPSSGSSISIGILYLSTTVANLYYAAIRSGLWGKIRAALVERVRTDAGRNAGPSYAIIDSQSVKTTSAAKETEGKNKRTQTAHRSGYYG